IEKLNCWRKSPQNISFCIKRKGEEIFYCTASLRLKQKKSIVKLACVSEERSYFMLNSILKKMVLVLTWNGKKHGKSRETANSLCWDQKMSLPVTRHALLISKEMENYVCAFACLRL